MPVDLHHLTNLLKMHTHRLSQSHRHTDLPDVCAALGLPSPPDEGSKAERVAASFAGVPASEYPEVAQRLLQKFSLDAGSRYTLEELLWLDDGSPRVPTRFRRELAETLQPADLFLDEARFEALLARLWVLDDDPLEAFRQNADSLRARIERHVFRNPGDWTVAELFSHLGAFDCSDRRFALFVEGMSSARVRPREAEQHAFASTVNGALGQCGLELRHTDDEEGYPVFRLVSKCGSDQGRPKNLIFASPTKPDLRFRDAINNDIEIVSNAQAVLVYDRPIRADGLRWCDLQDWWAELNGISDPAEAKRTLYQRLRKSLPSSSPPQQRFFQAYYKAFGSRVQALPALLPEVWLHWDPKTAKERGAAALARFRMDFLLLLPSGRRVVVEIDGKHHYAEGERASPAKYAELVAADRDLQLAGYEVYRFGAVEVHQESQDKVKEFFSLLFLKHGIGNV